ncbi:MAG TPA: SRPBCC family protein [Candidatus Nitrosotalea sp.]|nr:SRPBCC family protein [Candidatus Nitrosotalea sp.]
MTHWRVKGTCAEVADLLEGAGDLPRWWPSVYLEAKVHESGQPNALGDKVELHTKGWLPYTLHWEFTVVEQRHPYGFTIEARGDFVGRGRWTFEQDGEFVNVTYDWNLHAEKPLLRRLTPLLRPIFSANHRWAMRMGERSLELELARRHAASERERELVPAPPAPTFYRPNSYSDRARRAGRRRYS